MSVRNLAIASLAVVFFAPGAAVAEKVCVEEVAGVCLKYEDRAKPAEPATPQVPPAAREEQALGLSTSDRRTAQRALGAAGYYTGVVDGALGPRSRRGISEWQSAKGYAPTGYLTRDQFALLRSIAPPPAPAQPAAAQPAPAEPTQTAEDAPVFKKLDGPEQPSPTGAAAQPTQPQPKFKVLSSPSGSNSSATR